MYRANRYVAIALLAAVCDVSAAAPVRVTIDCSSNGRSPEGKQRLNPWPADSSSLSSHHVDSFCNLIRDAIPKAVQNGKFLLLEPEMDQSGFSDTQIPVSISPPEGFIPKTLTKLKSPKLKIPKLNIPKLRTQPDISFVPPKVGGSKIFIPRTVVEEESSAERMEKFKKGVQKLLRVVNVLGQIDQYLSDRTRIIVDKLSKTFAD